MGQAADDTGVAALTHMGLKERAEEAVRKRESLEGMRRAFTEILERQKEHAGRIPDLQERRERLRKTKESSVGDQALLEEAVANLRGNGFRVIMAKTAAAALRAMEAEVADNDLVVKSKSNITKELRLTEHLTERGVEVIETDLGDRIIQLSRSAPSHPTGPACHMTRQEIARLFTCHFGREISDDPSELTAVMREEIASFIDRAKVGLTGANAIAAREGAVVIVHNEGNAAKCAMVSGKHIVVTTPEKIVPNLEDAINVTKLQTYMSTGKVVSSFINVITGPSYTADIEKKVYMGMHGPREVVILFVDDGRLGAEDREAQYCIGCGACLLYCPTYNVVGPVFGVSGHMGGQGVYLAGSTDKLEESIEGGLYLCTSCGACKEVCPAGIDSRKGILTARLKATKVKKGMLPEHASLLASVRNYDNPWQAPRAMRSKWSSGLGLPASSEVLYFAGCSTSLLFPEVGGSVVGVLRTLGIEPAYLGRNEKCCGSTAWKLGDRQLATEKAEACFKDFEAAGARTVLTSCPGCASALNRDRSLPERYGVEVLHIAQFLDGRLDRSRLTPLRDERTVTYHDPCDLCREMGVHDEPRRLLAMALSSPIREMGRSGFDSVCCGSGSGVRTAFSDLADSIARDRVGMAKAVGAQVLVTSCPWCVQSLRDCQGEDPEVEVVDLIQLIERTVP